MRHVSDAYKRILEGMTLFATIRVSSEEDLLSHPVFMSVAANSVMSNKNSANLLGSRTLVGSGHIAISLDILCHKRAAIHVTLEKSDFSPPPSCGKTYAGLQHSVRNNGTHKQKTSNSATARKPAQPKDRVTWNYALEL